MSEAMESVSENGNVEAIAFGFPGITKGIKEVFEKSANYPQIEGVEIGSLFPEKYKDAKILVENDAVLGALGEAYFGAGINNKVVAYLTLSTGVGGARVIKYDNEYDVINAEPGHQIICRDDLLPDGSGLGGTFESYCSGSFFRKRYQQTPDLNASKEAWKKYSFYLSAGLLNIIAMWDPEIIILGGGLATHNFEIFYPYLMEEMTKQKFFKIPDIIKSKMGDDSGVYGGFILLKENL
jgi:glucokinase